MRILFVLALLLLYTPAFAGYSTVLEDLPLMWDMKERPQDTVVFDKTGGRIMEFAVETRAGEAEVQAFYKNALPPLGWVEFAGGVYKREGEVLKITVDGYVVHFSITPEEEKQP